jgi:CubicO group peptidase (beta-lactamase class C family)
LTYLYGRPLLDVLQERILDPVGASSAAWPLDEMPPWSLVLTPDGREVPVHTGWGGMRLTVDDLARVGYLFLNGGRWAETQLISPDYIEACWTESPFKPFRPTVWGAGYGLYWWRLVPGVWYMSGLGHQFCMVDVTQQMVMVKLNEFTGPYPNPMNSPGEVGLRRFYPLLYQATTGETFDVPEIWRIGWRARGRLPEDWDIVPQG